MTLVELLAVLAIIGVLMSLFMPAVQQARESARRIDCESRMRQLGLALHNYESAHRKFPPGAVLGGWSWRTMILPQMELANVYDLIDFGNNRSWPQGFYSCIPEATAQSNQRPDWDHLGRLFHCPSDPKMHPWMSNYLGVAGNAQPLDWSMARDYFPGEELESPGNGMLYLCSSTSTDQALDGSSQTLLIGEQGFNEFGGPQTLCGSSRGERSAWLSATGGLRPGNSVDSDHNIHYWSYHHGGTMFLFADGHVRLLNYSLDSRVYFGLASRNGGETIGEF